MSNVCHECGKQIQTEYLFCDSCEDFLESRYQDWKRSLNTIVVLPVEDSPVKDHA
jgi:hypothetical protein